MLIKLDRAVTFNDLFELLLIYIVFPGLAYCSEQGLAEFATICSVERVFMIVVGVRARKSNCEEKGK